MLGILIDNKYPPLLIVYRVLPGSWILPLLSMSVHVRPLIDPTTKRLRACIWSTKRMVEVARGDIGFMSFDTTHGLNWQGMYTGIFITENVFGDTEVIGYSLQVLCYYYY